jgi:hypothetical protein
LKDANPVLVHQSFMLVVIGDGLCLHWCFTKNVKRKALYKAGCGLCSSGQVEKFLCFTLSHLHLTLQLKEKEHKNQDLCALCSGEMLENALGKANCLLVFLGSVAQYIPGNSRI